MEVAGFITVLVAAVAFFGGPHVAVRVFVPSTLFGAAAAVNAPGVGSIQPSVILLAALAVIVFSNVRGLHSVLENVRCPRPGFWLVLSWVYGVLAAIFVPRLLAGTFLVNGIGSSDYDGSAGQVPFGPTTGNISQSVYFTIDLIAFFSCSHLARAPQGFKCLYNAVLAYCVGDIAMALIDLLTYTVGAVDSLSFIRNAKYVIYVDTETTNGKRIIGSFTEASAFAGATLGVLGFCATAWTNGLRPWLSLPLTLAALTFLLISTSSTAYAGLAVCATLFFGRSLWMIARCRASGRDVAVLLVLPLLLAACGLGIWLHPPTAQFVADFLDGVLFNKSASQSGIDRGALNQAALRNVFDTAGLGTGIGGVRTSSFVLAVLANLGVVGGGAYAVFIGMVLVRTDRTDADPTTLRIQSAARMACLWILVAASLSGALIDLGLPFFIFAALACARPGIAQRDGCAIPSRRDFGDHRVSADNPVLAIGSAK